MRLADLQLQAVGQSALNTQVELEVQTFASPSGAPLLFIRQPGEIRIRPAASKGVNVYLPLVQK